MFSQVLIGFSVLLFSNVTKKKKKSLTRWASYAGLFPHYLSRSLSCFHALLGAVNHFFFFFWVWINVNISLKEQKEGISTLLSQASMTARGRDTHLQKYDIFEYKRYLLNSWTIELASFWSKKYNNTKELAKTDAHSTVAESPNMLPSNSYLGHPTNLRITLNNYTLEKCKAQTMAKASTKLELYGRKQGRSQGGSRGGTCPPYPTQNFPFLYIKILYSYLILLY